MGCTFIYSVKWLHFWVIMCGIRWYFRYASWYSIFVGWYWSEQVVKFVNKYASSAKLCGLSYAKVQGQVDLTIIENINSSTCCLLRWKLIAVVSIWVNHQWKVSSLLSKLYSPCCKKIVYWICPIYLEISH